MRGDFPYAYICVCSYMCFYMLCARPSTFSRSKRASRVCVIYVSIERAQVVQYDEQPPSQRFWAMDDGIRRHAASCRVRYAFSSRQRTQRTAILWRPEGARAQEPISLVHSIYSILCYTDVCIYDCTYAPTFILFASVRVV